MITQLAIVVAACVASASALYLPGVSPVQFEDGKPVSYPSGLPLAFQLLTSIASYVLG